VISEITECAFQHDGDERPFLKEQTPRHSILRMSSRTNGDAEHDAVSTAISSDIDKLHGITDVARVMLPTVN
jgi:hypothetical protein